MKSKHTAIPVRPKSGGDRAVSDHYRGLEIDVSGVMENLLRENLLLEAKDLCVTILPHISMYSSQILKRDLVPRLEDKLSKKETFAV